MHVDPSRYVGLATLAACAVLGGCKAKENPAADTTSAMSATATTGDTSAMGGAAKAADTTAGAAGAALSDANIAALVDEVNMGDSSLAASALPKLTSAGAKDFARLMMGEHHAEHVQGMQVEKGQNIMPALPTVDPFKPAVEAEQTALGSLSKGAAYDSTYIAQEIGIHQAVLDWAGKNTPQNAAYQKYLKSAGSVYQKHLDQALALQKKMSRAKA